MAALNSIHHDSCWLHDDSRWPEVDNSRSYAVFMGCQQMAVRGLGLLVLTWATAVLLGGYVDKLPERDFRDITVITFLQLARVFDFFLKERTSDFVNLISGLHAAVRATLWRISSKKRKWKTCLPLWFVLSFAQLGVFLAFVLYLPAALYVLAALYVPGLWISAGLSISRLKVHDYGIADKRLTLALRILYSLGAAQGAFSLLSLWDQVARPGLAKKMAGYYRLDVGVVSEYLDEIVTGCMRHPSFSRGRNLVTYAVDLLLMESTPTISSSTSRACSKYLSGLTILGSILQRDTDTRWLQRQKDASKFIRDEPTHRLGCFWCENNPQRLSLFMDLCLIAGWWRIDPAESVHGGQPAVLKELLTASPSFGQVTHRLLETLGPGSTYSGEVREHAARILAEVAGSVRLEEFPGATQCISSLLDTFEEHCWRPEGYERDSDLPEEYERDWLLKEQERSYVLVVEHWRRWLRFRRLVLKNPFRCCVAMVSGDGRSPPPQVPLLPEIDDGEKSQSSLLSGYVRLVVSGLRVLQALAASEDNCRFISGSTRGGGGGGGGEVSRTMMRPLASDGLHRDHHDEWCMIAEESFKLLTLLTAAPGETGTALRVQIAGDTAGAVAALETVLGCPRCQVALKRQAVEVLLGLGLPPPVDTSSIVVVPGGSGSTTSSSTAVFMGILLHILLLPDRQFGGMFGPTHLLKKRSCTRRLAGEKLLAMVSALQQPSEDLGGTATTTSMLQAAGVVLGNLTSTVVGAGNDASWRIHAAGILQDLCQDYTKDDEYLKEIKKAMCLAMPEVIKQLLDGCGSATQAVTVTEAKKIAHCQAPAAGTDLEQGAVSDDTIGEETAASHHHRQQAKDDDEQPEGIMELYQALVSLCHGIPNSWMETDKDLASELDGIAADVCNAEGMPFGAFISLRAELKRIYCWEEKNARVRTN